MAIDNLTVVPLMRRQDPAAAAAAAMDAAVDDAAYERARQDFERSRPTSFAGLAAKLSAVREIVAGCSDGDDVLADAAQQIEQMLTFIRSH